LLELASQEAPNKIFTSSPYYRYKKLTLKMLHRTIKKQMPQVEIWPWQHWASTWLEVPPRTLPRHDIQDLAEGEIWIQKLPNSNIEFVVTSRALNSTTLVGGTKLCSEPFLIMDEEHLGPFYQSVDLKDW
jgi:hypothetical protein